MYIIEIGWHVGIAYHVATDEDSSAKDVHWDR